MKSFFEKFKLKPLHAVVAGSFFLNACTTNLENIFNRVEKENSTTIQRIEEEYTGKYLYDPERSNIIPLKKDDFSKEKEELAQKTQIPIPQKKPYEFPTYEVKKGDSVWEIAKRNLEIQGFRSPDSNLINQFSQEITKYNGIKTIRRDGVDIALIHPGDKIIIPMDEVRADIQNSKVPMPQAKPNLEEKIKTVSSDNVSQIVKPTRKPEIVANDNTSQMEEKTTIAPEKDFSILLREPYELSQREENIIEQNRGRRNDNNFYDERVSYLHLVSTNKKMKKDLAIAAKHNPNVKLSEILSLMATEMGMTYENDYDRGVSQFSAAALTDVIMYEVQRHEGKNSPLLQLIKEETGSENLSGRELANKVRDFLGKGNKWTSLHKRIAYGSTVSIAVSNRIAQMQEFAEKELSKYEVEVSEKDSSILADTLYNLGPNRELIRRVATHLKENSNSSTLEAIVANKAYIRRKGADEDYAFKVQEIRDVISRPENANYILAGYKSQLGEEKAGIYETHRRRLKKDFHILASIETEKPLRTASVQDNTDTSKYDVFMQRYGNVKELAVAAMVLGEERLTSLDASAVVEMQYATEEKRKYSTQNVLSNMVIGDKARATIEYLSSLDEAKLRELSANDNFITMMSKLRDAA